MSQKKRERTRVSNAPMKQKPVQDYVPRLVPYVHHSTILDERRACPGRLSQCRVRRHVREPLTALDRGKVKATEGTRCTENRCHISE